MAGQLRQQRQWALPRGVAPSANGYQGLSGGTPSFGGLGPAAIGWAVCDGGCHHGSGRLPVRHALAVMTAYWIDPKSRAVCICLLISSSVARKVAECGSSTTAPMSLSGKTGVRCRVVVA